MLSENVTSYYLGETNLKFRASLQVAPWSEVVVRTKLPIQVDILLRSGTVPLEL